MKSRMLLCAALVCLSQGPQLARAADEEARIKELERRVQQLEAGAPAEPAPAMSHAGMGSMDSALSGGGVPFHGFLDVGGGFQQHGKSGFTTGSFDTYLTPQFNDRVRALLEALIEFGDSGEPGIDLERAQIGYAFSDAFTIWLGRFHSPFGYYNTAFHHGKLMQTSIEKPRFLNFEDDGGVMPSHTVGTWATGAFRLGGGTKFTYDVYVGNSPSIKGGALDMNNLASENHTASRGLNLAYQGLGGSLRLGGHYYRASVVDDALPANDTKLQFMGPYAVFDDGVWEVIYEYYRWNNENMVSNTAAPLGEHRSTAWFGQIGRHFGQWMPYARYEKGSFNQDDNFFASLEGGRSYTRKLAGVRYDINPRAAFTVEYFHTEQDDLVVPDYNEMRFQFAIGF
jgi:hypothetical protein